MADAQAVSAPLLGLPPEIRLKIYEAVFTGLRYDTPNSTETFYRYTSRQGFEEIKSKVGLIWVNRFLRNESLPVMGQNLCVQLDDSISNVPLLLRENTTEVDASLHYKEFARNEHHPWRPEGYYKSLSATFPCLQHVRYGEHLETVDCSKIDIIISCLSGDCDENVMEQFDYDGLKYAVPAEGGPKFTFTVDIPIGFDFRHMDIDYVNVIYSLYQLEVDALRRTVIERYVNMQPWEAEGEWWVPAVECCVMVAGISWPAVYHKPTGRIRVLIMLRHIDSEEFDEDPSQEGRNETAAKVVKELASAEKLHKALELAYDLKKKTAGKGGTATE
ncbi:hypothetical protein LTR70_006838 [Exophiala xenobiotica]|uniref:Uncharacterized protein n=1 Tax=Lithohypha guttulata TaxID=1690604 RepID=A0ABR0K7U5_9EURO|nr:hypothetical protein LTR24_006447 [Lithohypha guttulata]KAK5315185.1 hypothetical protein LTR70_006838 [Exophiala xenobiotica]